MLVQVTHMSNGFCMISLICPLELYSIMPIVMQNLTCSFNVLVWMASTSVLQGALGNRDSA